MALRVIGIDHGSKESLVKDCGAEVFLDITKFDDKTLAEEVKKCTGGKEDLLRINMMCNESVDVLQAWEHQPLSFALHLTRPMLRLLTS